MCAWPQAPSEEALRKSEEHIERHMLNRMDTTSIMKAYPKHILHEMHDYWCEEREEKGSPACEHWEDVKGGGWSAFSVVAVQRRAFGDSRRPAQV